MEKIFCFDILENSISIYTMLIVVESSQLTTITQLLLKKRNYITHPK